MGLSVAGLSPEPAKAAIRAELLHATVRASLKFAEQPATSALSSTTAVALAKGVIYTMMLTKLKILGATMLACVLASGTLQTFALKLGGSGEAWGSAAPGFQHQADAAKKAVNGVQRRTVKRLVKNFPEKCDLSTPESAQAAWNRASARMDDQAVLELSWIRWGPRDIQNMARLRQSNPRGTEVYNQAQLNAEILEVATYREDLADVITRLNYPEGVGRDPYSSRSFGRINGVWKNLGEDRLSSLESARENFDRKKDGLWQAYVNVRDSIKRRQTVSVGDEPAEGIVRIAPGEPLGISVEKADLMGRVEWAMMHCWSDITARISVEWGEVQIDGKGNRSIRYRFDATIWDRDVYAMNKLFKFDAKGNIISIEDVTGFPKKKVAKPVDVSTEAGMKELVKDFFGQNFRDITSRETIEWGELAKSNNGNSSIRYKYRAKMRGSDAKIMNQVFTFDQKGTFVSVKDVEGFPRDQ